MIRFRFSRGAALEGVVRTKSRIPGAGGQFPIPRSPRLEAAAMDVTAASSAERDQILSETEELVVRPL